MIDDLDYAHGNRQPPATPGRSAHANVASLRRHVLAVEKFLKAVLLESPQKERCLGRIDEAAAYAESLIYRFDRNGPPVDQTELSDLEAVLRVADKNKDQFRAIDLDGLKQKVKALRQRGGSTP